MQNSFLISKKEKTKLNAKQLIMFSIVLLVVLIDSVLSQQLQSALLDSSRFVSFVGQRTSADFEETGNLVSVGLVVLVVFCWQFFDFDGDFSCVIVF